MELEMDVSLYPLGQPPEVHPVHNFIEILEQHDCKVEQTSTCLIITGESENVFDALRIGYEAAAQKSGCVLVIKVCNVCPL